MKPSSEKSRNRIFFPPRYLTRDGSYAVDRELGENWAEAGQSLDLYPEPHFTEANRSREKANWLIIAFIPLAVSLLFYTLAESVHPSRQSIRYTAAIVGTALLSITVVAGILIETTM